MAERHFREAVRLVDRGVDEPLKARALKNLAALLASSGRFDEAYKLFERALGIAVSVLGFTNDETGAIAGQLGCIKVEFGDFAGARPLLERALEISRRHGSETEEVASCLIALALAVAEDGDVHQAIDLTETGLNMQRRLFGARHPRTATAINALGVLYWKINQLEEARQLFEDALNIQEDRLGSEHLDTLSTLSNLACVLTAKGELLEAQSVATKAFETANLHYGPHNPHTNLYRSTVAQVLAEMHRYEEALPIAEAAFAELSALGKTAPRTISAATILVKVLVGLGRDAEASQVRRDYLE